MKMRISQIRESLGVTQEQLGEAVGLSGACISRIETGLQSKTFDRLARIAEALGVTVPELFDLGDEATQRAALIRLIAALDPADHDAAARVLRGLAKAPRAD
jgi:transcriptional regulator with XRE-family HTH domain